eukprot:TRINITY_DN1052_c0_g2_i1.p2 TRINITY_DN1052_c0_g2~~TRINITY_DN1052_c0_g2_i1.p2  ORF type:complete len:199 (-),score=50.59 TRINITY_DN1052_c0_g2_i1:47-643(-)
MTKKHRHSLTSVVPLKSSHRREERLCRRGLGTELETTKRQLIHQTMSRRDRERSEFEDDPRVRRRLNDTPQRRSGGGSGRRERDERAALKFFHEHKNDEWMLEKYHPSWMKKTWEAKIEMMQGRKEEFDGKFVGGELEELDLGVPEGAERERFALHPENTVFVGYFPPKVLKEDVLKLMSSEEDATMSKWKEGKQGGE